MRIKAFEISFLHYHYHSKANAAADALLKLPQKIKAEKKALKIENTHIFHKLQCLLKASIFKPCILDLLLFIFNLLHQIFIHNTNILFQIK